MENKIQQKIFIGFLKTGELKNSLYQNPRWKEDSFTSNKLIETVFKSREYIGQYIESCLPYSKLKEYERLLKQKLQFICPELNIDKQSLYIFTDLFVG
jgi:hypothetical protein